MRNRPGRVVSAHRPARVPHGADPPPFRKARLDRAADRHPFLDRRLRAGARRSLHSQAAMIPLTAFAGRTLAVFGLGSSGLAVCRALKAGGAEVIAGDDAAGKAAEAAAEGFMVADLRPIDWPRVTALVLSDRKSVV